MCGLGGRSFSKGTLVAWPVETFPKARPRGMFVVFASVLSTFTCTEQWSTWWTAFTQELLPSADQTITFDTFEALPVTIVVYDQAASS